MATETGVENHERQKFSLKKLLELISLSVYILIRKLWRVQTIFAVLTIIASSTLLFTFFYYDARLRTVLRQKSKMQVIKLSHN